MGIATATPNLSAHQSTAPKPAADAPANSRAATVVTFVAAFLVFEIMWFGLDCYHLRNRGEFITWMGDSKWIFFEAACGVLAALSIGSTRLPLHRLHSLLAFFVAVGTLSSIMYAVSPAEARDRVLSWWLLLFLAVFCTARLEPAARIATWAQALFASCLVFTAASAPLLLLPRYYVQGRFFGWSDHPNTMAMISALAFVNCCARALGAERLAPKLLSLTLAAGEGILLLATGSRGPRVMVIGTIVALAFTLPRPQHRRRMLAVIAAVVCTYLISEKVWEVANVTVVEREFSLDDRTVIWGYQIESFLDSPIIGHGFEPGGGRDSTRRTGGEGSYTDLLTAVGLTGTLALVIALYWGAYRLWWYLRSCGRDKRYAEFHALLPAFAMLVGALVIGMAEGYLAAVGQASSIYCWVVVASAAALPMPLRKASACA